MNVGPQQAFPAPVLGGPRDLKLTEMAPQSRHILAVSATGAVQRYHSKRAASEATGIPAATISEAASRLTLRDNVIWKFEDDNREVDMNRFQISPQNAPVAPTEADIERAQDFVDALRGDDGQMITEMRLSDGYISATKMCQSAGKMWGHYNAVEGNQAFRIALAASIGSPVEALVQSILDGSLHLRGTWVHPRIATHLAMWISTEFEVKVSGWIEKARQILQYIDWDYKRSLANLKPRKDSDTVEAAVRDHLAQQETGQVEVTCDHGRVDVLTRSEVIEVKRGSRYLHALGQVLRYAESFPEHRKRVHLILEADQDDLLLKAKRVCSRYGVDVTCETL